MEILVHIGRCLFAIWFVVDMKGDHAAEIASLKEKHKFEIEQLENSQIIKSNQQDLSLIHI